MAMAEAKLNRETTPLQNLFYYIRELYNATEPCYHYEQEPNNPKTEEQNYWKLSRLKNLAKKAELKNVAGFSFFTNTEVLPGELILKVKRTNVPEEPWVPFEIAEWITTEKNYDQPFITCKKEKEVLQWFDHSAQRVSDLETYELEVKSSLFHVPVPASLVGWVQVKGNEVTHLPGRNEMSAFTDDPKRVERLKEYEKAFHDYFDEFGIQIRINKIYDALHTLNYELKGRNAKQLYLSFGLVSGRIGGKRYHNFLFHVPLKLTLKNQEIAVEKDTFSSKIFCEQYFDGLLEAHFSQDHPEIIAQRKREVQLAVDQFNALTREFVPEPEFIRNEYFQAGLDILSVFPNKEVEFFEHDKLNYDIKYNLNDTTIAFSFSPVIQTRVIESQIAISKDAGNIINKINELQPTGKLHLVPDFFKKLFFIEGLDAELARQAPAGDTEPGELGSEHRNTDENEKFLFPLPYNHEQLEIARRLNEQDAVTVKGPPGTGKSHTIANIISHFVAQGKSILVISHNAKALSVIREKLPLVIQDLAVSLVNEGKGNDSLKGSVNAIIRNLSKRYDQFDILMLEQDLAGLEKRYTEILSGIYQVVQANATVFSVYNPLTRQQEEKSAFEWAVFYFDQGQYQNQVIRDTIHFQASTYELPGKLMELADLAKRLGSDDIDLPMYHFLPDERLMDVCELRKTESQLAAIFDKISIHDYAHHPSKWITGSLISAIKSLEKKYNALKGNATGMKVFNAARYDPNILNTLLENNHAFRQQVKNAHEKLLAFQLDLSPLGDTDPDILHQQIGQLLTKLGNAASFSWMGKSMLDKNLKRFMECRVNHIPASTVDQFKAIETEINRQRCLKQLNITFGNYVKSLGLQSSEPLEIILPALDEVADFNASLEALNELLGNGGLPVIQIYDENVSQQLQYLGGLEYYAAYTAITQQLATIKHDLLDHDSPFPLVYKMAEAIEGVDLLAYEAHLSEYRKKRELQQYAIWFEEAYQKLFNELPLTVADIRKHGVNGESTEVTKDAVETDIFYARINSFLEFITNQTTGSEKLVAGLQDVKKSIEQKIIEIIAYKTWYQKSLKVNDTQKAALNAWLNDLINIGKGYGRNTARNTASAVANMQVAKEAVPVWIMSQDRAITFFPDASPSQFDLLIIDEASQCDISSMNLIFRCKKSLVVGDENQTSVVNDHRVFTIERTNELLDKYLISHKFKTQFDVNNRNNSIYTISGVIYPNIVTLTEHFRCLPEIIGYSNQYVYNSDIVPLKTATDKLFGEPVSMYYVEDEAWDDQKPGIIRLIISQVEAYIQDYQHQVISRLPTIGILLLDSSNTKHQNLMIKLVSQSELIKQYEDQLELLIGTSREFQGDERDIMFLSITASHTVSEKNPAEIRPPRAVSSEEHMRIFNVAASRAKERSVVIHTIHPDAVAMMNPDCYRKKLIDYYAISQRTISRNQNLNQLQQLLDMTDPNSGPFEKSVCKFLFQAGFGGFLFPQFRVGKYRIDFAIIKNNKKIAIECDGMAINTGTMHIQADIDKQLILERAGWKFFRIQSTAWFYQNQQVARRLMAWINENLGGV